MGMSHILYQRHPLASVFTRLQQLDDALIADAGDLQEGWFLASDLTQPGSFHLSAALARQAHEHPQMEDRTKGSYFIGEYVWYVFAAAIAAYLIERRVPSLAPEHIALRIQRYTWHYEGESGEANRLEVRFLSNQFACLPHDPSAILPDAQIAADQDSLRDQIRCAVEAHMQPLIERVYDQTHLSRNAQWLLVADACAAMFLHLGQALQDSERAQREGMAFIRSPHSPMNNDKTCYITLDYQGHCETFRAHGGCCRYYTVSETGKDYCTTCVLRKPEDRDQRLLDYMAKKYAQEAAS
jgi:hypothetical protein